MRSMMAPGSICYVILISLLIDPARSYFIIPCGVDCEYVSEELLLTCSGRFLTCVPKPCCLQRTRFVDLSRNNITAVGPRAFQSFPNLHSLDLKLNSINSLSPRAFHGLRYLQTLDLKGNRLTTLQAGVFEGLLNLRSLTLSKNRISDIQPGTFRLLPNLKTLKLHHNLLQVIFPDTFEQLVELVSLDLDANLIHTTYQGSFSTLVNLQSLSLVNNNIASLPEFLSTLAELEQLHLKGNPLYCDCSLEFLRRWFTEHGDEESYRKSGECSQPSRLGGRLLATLTTDQLCRTSEESISYSYTSDEGESYLSPVDEDRGSTSNSIWTEGSRQPNRTIDATIVTPSADQIGEVRTVTKPPDTWEYERHEARPRAKVENAADKTEMSQDTEGMSQATSNTPYSTGKTVIPTESYGSVPPTPAPKTRIGPLTTYTAERLQSESRPQLYGSFLTFPPWEANAKGGSFGDHKPSTTATDGASTEGTPDPPNTTTPTHSNPSRQSGQIGSSEKSGSNQSNVVNRYILRGGVDGRSDTGSDSEGSAAESTIDFTELEGDSVDLAGPRKAPMRGGLAENYDVSSFDESPHPSPDVVESYSEGTTANTERYPNIEGGVSVDPMYNDSLKTDSVITALLGESITLACPLAVPAPLMSYLSYYDAKWLSPSGQWVEDHMQRFSFTEDGGLSITRTGTSDHGTYRCVRAQLLGAPAVASVRLRVACPCQPIPEMSYFTERPVETTPTGILPPRGSSQSNNGVKGQGLRVENHEETPCSRMPIAVAVLITFQVTVALCVLTFCGILSWRSSRKSKTNKIPRPESILETRPLSGINYYDRGEVPTAAPRMRSDIPTIVYESTDGDKPVESPENNSESDSALSSSGSPRNSSVGASEVYENAQHNSLRRDTQTYADLDPHSRSRHDTYSSLHLQELEDSE